MKGNLHGFLLAALMIAIAIGGTAHHLATAEPEVHAPPARSSALSAGVGLLERRQEVRAAGHAVEPGRPAPRCEAPVNERDAAPRCGPATGSPPGDDGVAAAAR